MKENLTNEVVEVVTETAEEVVTKVNLGTVVTGVCAVTGAAAFVYGAYKGVKWVYNTVKTAKNNKATALEAGDVDREDDEVEAE